MPYKANRIRVATSTSGLADFGLGAASSTAYLSFTGASIPDTSTVRYTAFTATEFECGEGVYSSGGQTLTRATILASSNAGAKVNFGTSPTLLVSPLAEDFDAPITWTDKVGSSALTITGATQTVSHPLLDLTQTWNASGTAFTGLKLNITNTASAAASNLLDVQIDNNTRFKLGKAGEIIAGPDAITLLSGEPIGISVAYDLSTHWAQVFTGYGNVQFSNKVWIQKTRGTSPTDYTLLSANDQICVLSFLGSNSVGFQEAVSIDVWVDGTPAAGVMPGRIDIVTNEASSGSLVRTSWDAKGNVIMNGKTGGASGALSTTASDGFLYLWASSGPPTGTPTAFTNRVPIAVDQTNDKLYIYSNSAWVLINP